MATAVTTQPEQTTDVPPGPRSGRRASTAIGRRNWGGGAAGWIWLLIVVLPIYWIIVTSFKTRANYFSTNPFLPASPTLDNYRFVIEQDFISFFVNSVIVTVGATVPAVAVSFMAAYAIGRAGQGRFLRLTNGLFLLVLDLPPEAVIIPIYLVINQLEPSENLLAIILPSIAF